MLHRFLKAFVRIGDLTVTFGDGAVRRYGDGSGPAVAARLTRRGEWRLLRDPELGLGEAYMESDLEVTAGTFWDLAEIVGRNRATRPPPAQRPFWRRFEPRHDRAAARRNARRHYDLSLDLYRRFLDEDLQYSCAYFAQPDMTLEAAQAAKKAHLAAKLDLAPGQRVLDIGSGWGGLALDLARRHQVRVTGVTLSPEQLRVARLRAAAAGLTGRIDFALADYRDVEGPFDRIVSVGMLEHVGRRDLPVFFAQVARLLAPDGAAVIHAIGTRSPPRRTQPFIARHIFPGGYIPALSEVVAAAEQAGLWIGDVEVLRLHYAQTLRCWRLRFLAARPQVARLYDERFCRMWEAYLCLSELAFRYLDCMVFQIQLCKRVDALPLTRDYMFEREREEERAWRRAG